ncbi:FAD-dependent oxidoreductase [Luteimonas aestuarii]|uniref:FAD-dependent oxidoreductase n=1 Tax=Luteimonas aestuarii TaxID=453837 RepID=A0A4R5TL98_9GAMM|nr:FAD-dependent oxidoreductase [Luteimonas aestuarii]TDK21722.1 FAD-dependent oxidoreductase [Luteimonas aestuarii]
MRRRGDLRDVVVVGGGVVGAACALALSRLDLDVVLVEAAQPPAWSAERPDLRVYAFAPDNAALFDALGTWPPVRDARVQPYRRMQVWDAAGGDALVFDADALARCELGWIVEHALLADRLWTALQRSPVDLRCPARVESLAQDDAGVRLRLDEGSQVAARIAIAADGAASTLRTLAGIDAPVHDHGQKGVVAYVDCQYPHEATAWQRFLPTGPLALLPFADGRVSIVWTLPDDAAARVLALDGEAFSRELTAASGGRLGTLRVSSPRAAFPLRRQLSATQCAGRVLVIGDAAHVVHPLAGQGVNLGLRDVSALQAMVTAAHARRADWHAPTRLARWARTRRSENAVAAHAFDGINALFSNDAMPTTLLRGHLLGAANRLPMVTAALWRRAAGL